MLKRFSSSTQQSGLDPRGIKEFAQLPHMFRKMKLSSMHFFCKIDFGGAGTSPTKSVTMACTPDTYEAWIPRLHPRIAQLVAYLAHCRSEPIQPSFANPRFAESPESSQLQDLASAFQGCPAAIRQTNICSSSSAGNKITREHAGRSATALLPCAPCDSSWVCKGMIADGCGTSSVF